MNQTLMNRMFKYTNIYFEYSPRRTLIILLQIPIPDLYTLKILCKTVHTQNKKYTLSSTQKKRTSNLCTSSLHRPPSSINGERYNSSVLRSSMRVGQLEYPLRGYETRSPGSRHYRCQP